MANTLTGGRENLMSRQVQAYLRNISLVPFLANFQENNTLSRGQSVNRPYRSDFIVGDYTANTDVNAQDWGYTQELLTVDQSKVVSIKIDPVETKQVLTNPASDFVPRLSYRLRDQMDQTFLSKVSSAALTMDAGDIGGSAGSPIDLSTVANVDKVSTTAVAKLMSNGVEQDYPLYWVVDPNMFAKISQRAIGVGGFRLADDTFKNGFKGDLNGVRVFQSNNLPATQDFTLSTAIPAANDTLTVKGITFTYQTTLGTTAGNILSETSVTQTAANTVAAITGGAGAGTKYVEVSSANRIKLTNTNVSATNVAGVITITGAGDLGTSKSFATAANGTLGDQSIYTQVAQYGATDAVVQMFPKVQINKAVNNLGSTYLAHTLYGFKMFKEGTERTVSVEVKGT